MAELEYRKVEGDELATRLREFPAWNVEGDQLARTFKFDTYKDGLAFASAVGFIADAMDHHPDMLVTYGKVAIRVNTHVVNGLSPYDFELARRIDLFANGFPL